MIKEISEKAPSSWLQISLEVDPELAEAVSEVFARHIPSGVATESTAVDAKAGEEGRPIGPVRVSGYIPVDAELEACRAALEQDLRYLALIQPIPAAQFQIIQEQNWMEAWKKHYRPLPVGERLLILPVWMEKDAGGRIPIHIDPGMAFGTGVHPSTQLSLQLLERYVKRGDSVIDVGCGSGILAIASAKLGAARVVAVDIDAVALENARHNAELNESEIEICEGSVQELIDGKFALQQVDIVLANILAPVLVRLLDDGLARLLKPQAVLILSGILAEQESQLREAIVKTKLHIVEERRIEDWVALALRR